MSCIALAAALAACGSTEASRTLSGHPSTTPPDTSGGDTAHAGTSSTMVGTSGSTSTPLSGGSTSGDNGDVAGGGSSQVATGGSSSIAGSSSSGGSPPKPPQGFNTDGALLAATFDRSPLGSYSQAQAAKDFGADPPWNDGLSEGRATIVEGADAFDGRSLRVRYPAGGVGPSAGGIQFLVPLAGNHQELYCAYRIRFEGSFNFVKGGKIPGLSGGNHPTGCSGVPSGTDGFTARMMWREGGAAVQYVYYPDQAQMCGDDFPWNVGGTRAFRHGEWYSLEHHLLLNHGDQADGLVEAWFDGELALQRKNVRFRSVDTIPIDSFYFSTFFGGSSSEWAPPEDEYIDFDDVVVSTKPITH
ncbi:MAG TPA: hypothetical protein VHB79_23245 [Polyangiaceae bacterium]|nr:hypothetical protein [Polyangiaceae bacterium]